MDLNGKISLVTGSSRGIGRAIALALASEGSNVVINYRKSKDAAEEVVKRIKSMGVEAIAIQADVSKYEQAVMLVDETVKHFGRIDALVNNAGVFKAHKIDEITPEIWHEMMDLNLNSMFYCTQRAIKYMKEQKFGKIVNVSSYYGLYGYPFEWAHEIGITHYATAKAGIIGFTKALAKEVAPYNIYVNVILPGHTLTEGWSGTPKSLIKKISDRIPLRRFATPEEIAQGVIFMLKDDFMTGEKLIIAGGL
ncbi:MAG: SDR family NAD(P)-dependent oxidoreductase [Candidatus Asgardarchaeia archaeon]